ASLTGFSPLFIGEPRAATGATGDTAVGLSFSPLFIGEPRAAPRATGTRSHSTAFQSPLHRGAARGRRRGLTERRRTLVSVPSSSWRRARLDRLPVCRPEHTSF